MNRIEHLLSESESPTVPHGETCPGCGEVHDETINSRDLMTLALLMIGRRYLAGDQVGAENMAWELADAMGLPKPPTTARQVAEVIARRMGLPMPPEQNGAPEGPTAA